MHRTDQYSFCWPANMSMCKSLWENVVSELILTSLAEAIMSMCKSLWENVVSELILTSLAEAIMSMCKSLWENVVSELILTSLAEAIISCCMVCKMEGNWLYSCCFLGVFSRICSK